MRLKIFTCHHLVPDTHTGGALYETLVTGQRPPPGSPIRTDLDGRNIAHAANFSELRQQYYVWQNRLADYDYVGFEHYRRPFFLDPMPLPQLKTDFPAMARIRSVLASNKWATDIHVDAPAFAEFNRMRSTFTDADTDRIHRFVADHDILFTYPLFEPPYKNFRVNNQNADFLWHAFVASTKAVWARHFPQPYVDPPAPWSGYRNMYILKSELFDEYMDILFTVLLPLDQKHPDAPPRIWGYLAELTFGAFITQKTMENPLLRTRSLPYLFMTSTGV